MSNDEEDYLSDKFLAQIEATSKTQQPKSYSEKRKQASRQSQLLNERNRRKSRKQRELEAREEALQTSLIEKAQEEAKETGKQNKALAIMMKMGFKPGQSLGESHEGSPPFTGRGRDLGNPQEVETSGVAGGRDGEADTSTKSSELRSFGFKHRAEPLPIKEWAGKTGIGGVKRPPSPTTLERAAKIAKQSENLTAEEFRNRARKEYEDRRAEGRLRHARTTCVSLDTKADINFNRFWLDAGDPESFPPGLLEALEELWSSSSSAGPNPGSLSTDPGAAARLKAQIQADALRPLNINSVESEEEGDERPLRMGTGADSDRNGSDDTVAVPLWPEETLLQVGDYLRLSAPERLEQVLGYLRGTYYYCLWCGTQYATTKELESECPGLTEEDHD